MKDPEFQKMRRERGGGSRDVHEGVGFERVGAGTPVEIRGRAGRVGARRWWHEGLVLQRVGVVSAEWRLGVEVPVSAKGFV